MRPSTACVLLINEIVEKAYGASDKMNFVRKIWPN